MPTYPIIDTHVHLWDPQRLSYGWLRGNVLLDQPYLVEDYQCACGGTDVAAMVFVECDVDVAQIESEVRFVEEEARRDPRIKGIVAKASLEQGSAVLPELERLKTSSPLLRGIRRLIESETDLEFCLNPSFVQGVRQLRGLGLSFEVNVNYRHMDNVLRFVERVGDVALMLDHCGKPGIREGRLEPWGSQLRTLAAARPNMFCKLSGLVTEADHRRWTELEIRPYIDVAVEAFGFERLVFGGDWPVCVQAAGLTEWTALLDRAFTGVSTHELKRFWQSNAIDFYRLEIPQICTVHSTSDVSTTPHKERSVTP